jgi:phosphodiesterase/alkaline phosphatase D-like protein
MSQKRTAKDSPKNSRARLAGIDDKTLPRRQFISATLGGIALSPLLFSGCGGDDGEPPDACSVAAATGDKLSFSPEQVSLQSELFPLTVQAGAMSSDRALLWSYVKDGAAKRLVVWREDEVVAFDGMVTPREGGYFRHWVEKLTAGATYRYAFFSGGSTPTGRSAIGRFRCPPAAGCLQPVTFGATVCTHMKHAPFTALSQTAQFPIDALCHLGDISYNDGAKDRTQFREMWQQTYADPGYQALMPHAGLYATWDDHEIVDNSKLYDLPREIRRAGTEAFFEHVPVPRISGDRFWTSYRWGSTLELFVLDCRSERKPDTRETNDAIYISREQLAWLQQGLKNSPCHFKVVLNSVPIAGLPPFWIEQQDRWAGYASQREQLLETCETIDNVWFLAGDFHLGAVWRVETEGPRQRMWEIVVGPGGNRNDAWIALEENPFLRERVITEEQFAYFSSKIATSLVTFDPQNDDVRVQFIDPDTGASRFDRRISQRD